MMGQLITLPLRLTARAGSVMLRGTEAVLSRALALAGHPLSSDAPAGTEPAGSYQPPPARTERARRPAERTHRRATAPTPAPAPAAQEPATVEPPPAPAAPPAPPAVIAATPEPVVEEPTHVSEEPEVVREEAEPGAEDGAGAQVTIDEPWEGYARLTAKDVIARVSAASQAELAAVTLYEQAHQARQSVLSAVERQLALTARGGTSN